MAVAAECSVLVYSLSEYRRWRDRNTRQRRLSVRPTSRAHNLETGADLLPLKFSSPFARRPLTADYRYSATTTRWAC